MGRLGGSRGGGGAVGEILDAGGLPARDALAAGRALTGTRRKVVLITGVTARDGACLAELLLGLSRRRVFQASTSAERAIDFDTLVAEMADADLRVVAAEPGGMNL
jgi:hypothetical protein